MNREPFRPFIFDVLAPDGSSILGDYKMALRCPLQSLAFSRTKAISRIVTRGGVVEQHWGDALTSVTFQGVTGGFVRRYAGLSSVTGGYGALNVQGTRRETLAHEDYLNFRALFHSNGSVYDDRGTVRLQGSVQMTFAEGVYEGFFSVFGVSEDKVFQFTLSTTFNVTREILTFHTGVVG